MSGVNKAIIVGRLGKNVDMRYSQQGAAIANFSVATSEEWFDKASGEKKERTEWHRVTVFGKMGENCGKFLAKGSLVYLEGRIQTDSYEKDGQKVYTTGIVANTVQFLSPKSEKQEQTPQYAPEKPFNGTPMSEQENSELPF